MIRCYDCGQPIPDEQIVRRTVQTGVSLGKRSSRSYYRKVSLCPVCSASRDRIARTQLIVLLAIGGSLLFFCVCGGLLTSLMPRQPTTRTAVQAPDTDRQPTTHTAIDAPATNFRPSPGSRYNSTGTITKLDGYVRFSGSATFSITIEHNGIPAVLSPGTQTFKAYSGPPEAALKVTVRNLKLDKSAVGQKVDFVLEWHDQWFVVELMGKTGLKDVQGTDGKGVTETTKFPTKEKKDQDRPAESRRIDSMTGDRISSKPPVKRKDRTDEDAAAVKLKIAKGLHSDSLRVDGKEGERLERAYIDTLHEIIKKYPMTEAAKEAKELLDKTGK